DLGGRDLEDVRLFDRRHPVARAGGYVDAVALGHAQLAQRLLVSAELEVDGALDEQDALVLALVVLERERLAPVDVEDLAEVAVGDRPANLVAPWLFHPALVRPLNRHPGPRRR